MALAVGIAALPVAAAPAGAGPSVDVLAFGAAPAYGAPDFPLNAPVIDLAAHPTRPGYWILGRDGGVFTYGEARFFGSTGAIPLNAPVVGIAPTPTGDGYWLVALDGGIFSFGDARFFGSTGALTLNAPVIGMAPTPTGNGYWLVALDGGVFSFGDARFFGSAAGAGVATVAIAPSRTGRGYLLLGADGSLRGYGDAPALAGTPMPQGAVDLATTTSGAGAWVLGGDGSVFTHGDAPFHGAATNDLLAGRGIARLAAGGGYWVALVPRPPQGPPAPPDSGTGRRIVYSNSQQRVWLVEADDHVAHSWLVSGRRGVPRPGTYHVFSKSVVSYAHGGSLRLPYMTRFAWGSSLAIGFHGIPLRGDGTPIQGDDELGEFRSAGCVRMNQDAARTLFDWAPIGTPVVVLP
jgi:hypothetical protein